MKQDVNLRLEPRRAWETALLKQEVARNLGLQVKDIDDIRILRRSIDARQRNIMVNLTVRAYVGEKAPAVELPIPLPEYHKLTADAPQAIVVGAGPAGLFAALRLIEEGIHPVVLERGKDVDSRRHDMAAISRDNVVNPDSNYCFGEGGAGAFSDGKLYTRSKKRGSVEKILTILYMHGAQPEILIDAHPHIGTDRLPVVIKAMRERIIECGGEVYFDTRVTSLLMDGNRVTGVCDRNGKEWHGPVIMATGHSARDTYRMLQEHGIELEPKGIAVGVRLEHPQQLIDRIMYHDKDGRGRYLPPAEYSMLTRVDGRAVYSFCMCPGGVIIPAASGPGVQVVNGMSPAGRGGRRANSGMVVEILPEDIPGDNPLRMMDFQEDIESGFLNDSNGTMNAPAQRMTDFVKSQPSKELNETSYTAGIHPARVDKLLPPGVSRRLQVAFREFDSKHRGFLTTEATVIGCETRTSAPVRVPRDKATMQHVVIEGLYPCGEGAGYAGGIVSAAMDGENSAVALAQSLKA